MKPSSLPAGGYATRRVYAEATDLLRWLAYKLIGIALATTASFLVPGAVAGLAFGSFCAHSVESEGTALGEWLQTSTAFCQAISRFGLACALTGIAIALVWGLTRGWPRPQPSAPATGDAASDQSLLVLALGFGLGAAPILTVMSAHQALAFVLEHLHLLNQQMDGIVLMVPILQLTIAAAWLAAGIGLFLLFITKDRLFPRTFLVALPVQIGLLIVSYQVLAATRLVTVPVAEEIPMAVAHAAAIASVVRGLAWGFAIYAIMAPCILRSRTVRGRFADQRFDDLAEGNTSKPVAPAEASGSTAEVDSPAARGFGRPMGTAKSASVGSRFYIQVIYVGGIFGARLQIQDLDAARGLTAQVAPLRFRSQIHIRSKGPSEQEILHIEARRVLSWGGPYDVFDSGSNALVAVIRKRLAGDWEIYDAQDQLLGVVTRGEWGMGHATDRAVIGTTQVGSLHWSNVLKPALELDYSMDVDQLLDHRVGLAAGVLLFLNRSLPNT